MYAIYVISFDPNPELAFIILFYRDHKQLAQSCSEKVQKFIWTQIYITPNLMLLSPH